MANEGDPSSSRLRSLAVLQRLRAQLESETPGAAPVPASHDRITGLPGQQFFMERVDRAILRAEAQGHTAAVAWLAVDGVEPVREIYGAAAEEACIAEVGRRLRTRARPDDFVARVDPRFWLLFEPIDQPGTAHAMAQAVQQAVRAPFDLRPSPERAPVRVVMNARIGIAVYPRHAGSCAALLQRAAAALEMTLRGTGGIHIHE